MKKKILCLMMAAILAVGAPLTAFARDYQGADGWQATFDGSKLNSNFKDEDVTDSMSEIQPGDSITLHVQLTNQDSSNTDWYMTMKSFRHWRMHRIPHQARLMNTV